MKKRDKREKKKKDRGIVDFMMVTNHFFSFLNKWISEMKDPRNQSYITYKQTDLVYLAILKNVCGQYTMRQMEENFNEENCIDTLRIMSGSRNLDEMPHYDTLNYYLEKLSPECLAELRKKMVTSLIRGKHCDNCLCSTKKTEDGKKVKLYYHKVLEAKIAFSDNVVISLGTEFIENENEDVSKQEIMNVFEYEYESRNKEGKKRTIRFQWITNIELTKRNLEEMIMAGRGRWKIENEGFNNQKNGLYRIEHLNSRNSNAMKNHYLFTQIY